MTFERHSKAIGLILSELGVEAAAREPIVIDPGADGYVVRMTLPYHVESMKLHVGLFTGDPSKAIDLLVSGRDRLFSAALAHMAEHSYDVRAILDGMRRAAEKRERLASIITGIAEAR